MKLCVFQGTFNPIHNAHLRVAQYVCSKYNFDKFLFIPAYLPPHKNSDTNFANARFEMVKLATQDNPMFEFSDIEFKRGGKSYSYLTIKELYDLHEITDKIHFIIGTDAFKYIESWYESDNLKKLVKFIVFIRDENFNPKSFDYLKEKGYDFEFETLDFWDISSTNIRQKIKSEENIENFVPKKVKEYILNHGLYKS